MPPLAVAGEIIAEQMIYDFASDVFPDSESGCKQWTIGNSSSVYRVDGWGAPYFFINAKGNINVRPHGDDTLVSEEIDLVEVVERAVSRGLALPLIVRFPDILNHRLTHLNTAFNHGILKQGYEGRFQGVFPVKCNPDRYIVEDIVKFGDQFAFGLEAGSKPELLMAISCLCNGNPNALLICNGYKDIEYVQLALMARQLGVNSVIVLEQADEIDIVLNLSQRIGLKPVIGIRAKLNTKHDGHWGETSGDKGKFGLSASEMVAVVSKLRRAGMLECLQLLHFHIGSQIPSIPLVKEGISEAAQIFCELSLMGAKMNYIDIGGGLGVDYDGTNSASSEMSIGYTVEEYAEQVVEAIKIACVHKTVKQPIICCESGRGLVSYQSVLVFDVLSAHVKGNGPAKDRGVPLDIEGLPQEMSVVYQELACFVRAGDYEAALDYAKRLKVEGTRRFKLGIFSLELRASIEETYEVVAAVANERAHQRLLASHDKSGSTVVGNRCATSAVKTDHTSIYQINLSIFKSAPDSWAINQLFPIVPIHRHQEEPCNRAILTDLTCDSDGKVASFIGDDAGPMNYVRLHELEPNKPYYMGMFLGGAYQEILGSMHNLFGTPNIVCVVPRAGGGAIRDDAVDGFHISRVVPGQTIAAVLRAMQHEPHGMFEILRRRVEDSIGQGRFNDENEAVGVLHSLGNMFSNSTYLSNDFSRGCAFSSLKLKYATPVEHAYCCS